MGPQHANDRVGPLLITAVLGLVEHQGRVALDPDAARRLSTSLAELAGDASLIPAVLQLVELASFLDKREGGEAAARAVDLIAAGAAEGLREFARGVERLALVLEQKRRDHLLDEFVRAMER
jgi:hypothetical protein